MDLITILNKPIINAVMVGIIMYIIITLSNMGDPVLGSILSTFPIGLLGLLAIHNAKRRNIYISNTAFTNIIIVVMWIFLYIISKKKFKRVHILHAFLIWVVLCVGYYILKKSGILSKL